MTCVGRVKVSAKPATRRKALKSTGSTTAQDVRIRREIPEAFRKWDQKAKTSKREWKWQRGIATQKSFIEEDNHCAMDVGHLRKDTRTIHVRKP